MGQNGSGGPPISVMLCTNFSSSGFAVALCKKAVELFFVVVVVD